MYKVSVLSDFSSAHMLRGYKGKCENLHGHNWNVEVSVYSGTLDKLGMVIDFKVLKKAVHNVLDGLDHKNLNDLPYFKKVNPTSENIAKYIYDKISSQLSAFSSQLKITVWESDTSQATYKP
jgi:6-pyruvoyltetrahydropterin/6-carboxytetrahydropterin synthase